MNSKRLLTLLVALCLTFGAIAPAAGAVQAGAENAKPSVQQSQNTSTGNWFNDLVASAGEFLGLKTLRDDQSHLVDRNELSFVNGQWIATAKDGISAVLSDAELPEDILALRKAADHYSAQDVVFAFVELEADPTAELYSSILDVPAELTASLNAQQNALISAIEQKVLSGEQLQVVSRFTHLTNSVVVATEFGNLEAIADLQGVKSVFLSPVYSACETSEVVYPATTSSSVMSGAASVWQDLGYTGKGMTIAILDTGLDVDHPSFAADPAGPAWTLEKVQEMLDTYDLQAETLYAGTLTAEDLYYSAKVPFTFNYATGTTNVGHADGLGDHGTHVAGIAAANNLEGSGVVGMAPDAQIIAMKVFNPETGGSNMFDLIKALEDCMILGVDVVNMSLGSPAGFSETDIPEIDEIFARIDESDMIVDVAAGNEGTSSFGSSYGYYMQTTNNIDNATISSPSTYANSMSIASVDNAYVYSSVFTLADGTEIFYMQAAEWHNGYIADSLEILAGSDIEYVMVPGLGYEEDFYDADGNSIVEGKIAVIKRGDLTFGDKAMNAEFAGAVGVLIWDNVSEDIFTFGMSIAVYDVEGNEYYPSIPAVLISLEDGQIMNDAAEKTMNVAAEPGVRKDVNGGQMSSFSCWGVSPDLRLLPDISGVGGNIYSCYDGGLYGLMSGTSMACPQVAGVTALVLQYLKETFPEATDAQIRQLCDSLLMSTAVTVIDNTTGLEASPRQQGAGLANALNAITAEAYLTVEGSERPKAELGDNANGEFSFTFTVHNFSDAAKTYDLRASLLCEDYITDEYFEGLYFMAEYEHELDNSAVSFSADSVTVEAGSSVDVTVTIALTDADMTWIETYFPSGNYVEGYVYLEGENEVTLSLPFLGFCGAWDDAPVFDTGYWYQNGFWADVNPDIVLNEVEANEYYHVLWTNMAGQDWVLGFNPYEGVQVDENGDVIYSEDNNVLSPNGDGALDAITELYLSLMRNAEELYLVYEDAEGNVLHEELLQKESKTMYISGYGSVVPFVYSWYYDDLYDFTDAEGNYLADGTTIYLTISGVIDYEGAQEQIMTTFPLHIDTAAPVLDADSIVESSDDEGNYITLSFTEEHPAFVALMNPAGTQVYERYSETDFVQNEDGSWSVTLNVTGRGDKFSVVLADYGCNESYYDLTWSATGTNNPEVDPSVLYAYQTYNSEVYMYYGWDYMFGWHSIDKQTANVTQLSSDAYEYYALTAAEYAGGYVFAVDAGYNFLYMIPGLWNRNLICNLGVNVVDMAFDEVTQTMYLATSDNENYNYCLYTVDLLTGELTELNNYWDKYSMPWAMTFVDGELYCCKYEQPGFYRVDLESGWYDLIPVYDAEGNEFMPQDASGMDVAPYYNQSMTYSAADGVIYWSYYSYMGCALITIDPSDWSYNSLSYMADQQYIGLLTAEDDGYVLPESDAVNKIALSDEQLVIGTDMSYQLSAVLLPWNAPVTENVVWTSSDESVVTVVDGLITTLNEGVAYITASYGDVYAECVVNVVNIEGNLNAYKYTDANWDSGYWLDIDLVSVTEEGTFASPVDFIAADYNGHTGIIYGYDGLGQCYWFDPVTGEYDTLGAPVSGMLPADMAYDYSTGLMYVIIYDANTMSTTLYALNMKTGALVEYGIAYDIFITLACSTDGTLYAIDYMGYLFQLELIDMGGSDIGGGGIGGWEPLFDDGFGVGEATGSSTYYIEPIYLMETLISPYYAQSMCYDHNNDVLLWINPETGCIYWIDGLDTYAPFMIALGDPSGTGYIEYVGAHVIPEEIPELPFFPVTSASAEDLVMLVGQSKPAQVSVLPLNATSYIIYNSFSMDESVAYYDEQTGMVVAVGEGTTMIGLGVVDCGEDLVDDGVTDPWYDVYFTVTVKNPTDNIYGYLMQDNGTGDGGYWMEMLDEDPAAYIPQEYVYYNGMFMIVYSAEYIDGKIYAYGYDMNDYSANFQFLTIDASSWSVIDAVDMGKGFPFVYDMAFDYTTGTMFALAGPSDTTTDLYYVNLNNGELIDAMATGSDYMFLSLAIDAEGTIYAMASSVNVGDYWTPILENAQLYTLDPETGAIEWFMDSGATSNMLASMSYDHDTGYIYWHGLDNAGSSGLYLIDLEAQTASKLGTVGPAGAQVTGLMVIADNYPEIPETLSSLVITNDLVELNPGNTDALELFLRPANAEVELVWTSADESIVTVDENGVVTAVSAGVTTVTVEATDIEGNVETSSSKIIVYGDDDYFISYNVTDGGFAQISRPNSAIVSNFTESDGLAAVTAMEMVNGYIFAYDEDGNLFYTSVADNFERTYVGHCGITVDEPYTETNAGYYTYIHNYTPNFVIRDMAYDSVNGRLLALACEGMTDYVDCVYPSGYVYSYTDHFELDGGCRIYEVDMKTGALTELFVVGGDSAESGVRCLAITASGEAYVYTTFMDYIMKMDLETGAVTYLSTFQNHGVYGSSDGYIMSMTYDEVTDAIYMTLTQNGKFYKLYKFDTVTQIITEIDYIGEVVYDRASWAYIGDRFSGLILNKAHEEHVYEAVWTENSYTKYSCICGDSYIESRGLIFTFVGSVEADCNNSGTNSYYCEELNVTYVEEVPAIGHEYVITESIDGDCTKDGSVTYTCECGDSYTEYTYAKGHEYQETVYEPTCEEDGYTDHVCSVCGDSYQDNIVDAFGHNYESEVIEPSGAVDGEIIYTCTICGDSYSEVIEANHNYEVTVIAPTCMASGQEIYTCTDEGCGYSYTVTLDPLGHNYEKEVFEATCDMFGCVMYYCVNEGCYHAYTEDYVEAVGHIFVAEKISGSCTEDGQIAYTCKFCGLVDKVEDFVATGHSYGKWYVVKEATETQEGRQLHVCTECGVVEYEIIPVIGADVPATEPVKPEDDKSDEPAESEQLPA